MYIWCVSFPGLSITAFVGMLKGKLIAKGKLAIRLLMSSPGLRRKPYWGNHFLGAGYFVNTTGIDEELIRRHAKHQEKEREEERSRNDYDLFK